MYLYEVQPRKDHRGFDLISDALPFGALWYGEPNAVINAIGYVKHRSRSHHAVIRVYVEAGKVVEIVQPVRLGWIVRFRSRIAQLRHLVRKKPRGDPHFIKVGIPCERQQAGLLRFPAKAAVTQRVAGFGDRYVSENAALRGWF